MLPATNKIAFNKNLYGTNFPTSLIHFPGKEDTAGIEREKPPDYSTIGGLSPESDLAIAVQAAE